MLNTQNDVDEASVIFQKLVQAGQQLLIMHLYSDAGVMEVTRADVVVQGEKLQEAVQAFMEQCDALPPQEAGAEEE